MAVKTILSDFQRTALYLFKKSILAKKFYLAGGTALAEFYLKHRKSEDLDFFTEDELDISALKNFSLKIQKKVVLDKVEFQHGFGLYSFFFYPKGEVAKYKIDFGQYPFGTINPLRNFNGVKVEDLYDIAVDKVHTISVRPRSRDFIDLYFIFKLQPQWGFDDLLKRSWEKFEIRVDPLQLGENLLKVDQLADRPIMLKELDIKKMRRYFLDLAGKLSQKIFK